MDSLGDREEFQAPDLQSLPTLNISRRTYASRDMFDSITIIQGIIRKCLSASSLAFSFSGGHCGTLLPSVFALLQHSHSMIPCFHCSSSGFAWIGPLYQQRIHFGCRSISIKAMNGAIHKAAHAVKKIIIGMPADPAAHRNARRITFRTARTPKRIRRGTMPSARSSFCRNGPCVL